MSSIVNADEVPVRRIVKFLEELHGVEVYLVDDASETIRHGKVALAAVDGKRVVGLIVLGYPIHHDVIEGEVQYAVPVVYVNAFNIFTARKLIREARERVPSYPVVYGVAKDTSLILSYTDDDDVEVGTVVTFEDLS
jgi:hypothetical protein